MCWFHNSNNIKLHLSLNILALDTRPTFPTNMPVYPLQEPKMSVGVDKNSAEDVGEFIANVLPKWIHYV